MYHPSPGMGEGGTYHAERACNSCGQTEWSCLCPAGAHAPDGCAPPRGAVDLSKIQRLLPAFCQRDSHSFILSSMLGIKKGGSPRDSSM